MGAFQFPSRYTLAAEAIKSSVEQPLPVREAFEVLSEKRYPFLSSSGSRFHQSQPTPAPTAAGMPIRTSSQNTRVNQNMTTFAIDHMPSEAGTSPDSWASFANHR